MTPSMRYLASATPAFHREGGFCLGLFVANATNDFLCGIKQLQGISPQSCTETDFEMKTSDFVLFLLISVVSVHFRAIYDETIRCQA